MKYLLFDDMAVALLTSTSNMQSIEYENGKKLVDHFCGLGDTEMIGNLVVQHFDNGILFTAIKSNEVEPLKDRKIYCIDLTTCNILIEKDNKADLLTVMQKSFRTVLKIWNRQPFSSSERINGSKSIIFPFVMGDRRRLVIERSISIPRLEKRGISYPLLAYKYSPEDPKGGEETVDTSIIRSAGENYISKYYEIQNNYLRIVEKSKNHVSHPLEIIQSRSTESREDFAYWGFEEQYKHLTDSQKFIVDSDDIESPIRIDGAAGTGKTISLIMRAYKLLKDHRNDNTPFSIVFFSHNESTCRRNQELFELYDDAEKFLDIASAQHIRFITLLSYCKEFGRIQDSQLLEKDAGDAKTYQLMMIEAAVQKAIDNNTLRTYKPLLSEELKTVFSAETPNEILYRMLQHEFGVQIKGRTDCTIDSYYELKPINNGLPCSDKNKKDKELVFRIFTYYQDSLKDVGQFDVDDVVLEAYSRLNGPVWRRDRQYNGYDYIFVDEMHLFNINEQSIFHLLTKDIKRKIPICFALDYCQAIGDRGDTGRDYVASAFEGVTEQKLKTVFRNSSQITEFCAAIAASGTLMFREDFMNPYSGDQIIFTEAEERNCDIPKLYMYQNEDSMIKDLKAQISSIKKMLACKPGDIAIITFDMSYASEEFANKLGEMLGGKVSIINGFKTITKDEYILATPYTINGLEFKAVVMLGVDEGRVPQTKGTSDISQHFIKYSAFNMLYLSASRAKYILTLMGNILHGKSSCLEYALERNVLEMCTVQ